MAFIWKEIPIHDDLFRIFLNSVIIYNLLLITIYKIDFISFVLIQYCNHKIQQHLKNQEKSNDK